MEHTTFPVPVGTEPILEAEAVTLLYHTLQALPAPRRKPGKRYPLAVILCLVVLAKLAGAPTRVFPRDAQRVTGQWSKKIRAGFALLREHVQHAVQRTG